MTGDWPPAVGSTVAANASPDVAAIFSPAKLTAAKPIVRTKPTVSPINSSCIIIKINFGPSKTLWSGKSKVPSTQKPKQNENTILICRGTILPPKKGAEIKNAPTLKEAINNKIKKVNNSCNSSPGRAPNSLTIGNKSEPLSGNFVKNIGKIICHLGDSKSSHQRHC